MKLNFRKLLALLIMASLVACASSDEVSDSESELGSGSTERSESRNSFGSDVTVKKESSKKSQSSESTENQILIEAIKSGNDEATARAAQSVLAQNPQDLRALNALGMYHFKKSEWKAAELFYGRALKVNPNLSELHNNLGLVSLAKNEPADAIESFKKAISINSDPAAAANLGSLYLAQKNYSKALVGLEIAYRKNKKDVRLLNNYGIALTGTKKFSDAREIYKKAHEANPNDKDILLNYSILMVEHLGRANEGLDLINKLKFLGPSAEARNIITVLEKKANAELNKN